MKVHYFGDLQSPLLGTLHHTPKLRSRSTGILLCNPFGEEATRAHRVFRVLASQLDRSGYATLRFDYSATGDSGDHPGVASLARWQQDIAIAAEQLLRTANVSRLVVLGLGLGALLAFRASVDGLIQPRHLMLWDPVVDGSEYLRELAAAHRQYMDAELPLGVRDSRSMVDARGYATEALGSVLALPLVDELAATDISRLAPAAELVTVICTRDTPAMRKLRASLGSGSSVTWLDMQTNSDWNSEAALNNATVPIDVVEAIVRRVQESSP